MSGPLSVGGKTVSDIVCVCRELWRRDAAIAQSVQASKDELHKWEKALRGTMSKVRT